jgi:hypothetical protein
LTPPRWLFENATGMTSIDRADGHLEEARTWNRACRHIALFLWWAAERGLADAGIDPRGLARSPVRYFLAECDGKLQPEDLDVEGRAFAEATYRAYAKEVEAYARKLRVGGFDVPANRATANHFFAWLDARLATWRRKRPKALDKAKPERRPPRLTARQVLALARGPAREAPEGFGALLMDAETGDAALEVLHHRRAWTAPLVPRLTELVARELPRKRPVVLGAAMAALGWAQTKPALQALVALHGDRRLAHGYRAQWLAALSCYRAPAAKRVLTAYADAGDAEERFTASAGLVRNGSRQALVRLRRAFEEEDVSVAREAARQVALLLKTPFAVNEQQLARLVRWWDAHPDEIRRRVDALHR